MKKTILLVLLVFLVACSSSRIGIKAKSICNSLRYSTVEICDDVFIKGNVRNSEDKFELYDENGIQVTECDEKRTNQYCKDVEDMKCEVICSR